MSSFIGVLGTLMIICFAILILHKVINDLFSDITVSRGYPCEYFSLVVAVVIAIVRTVLLYVFASLVSGRGMNIFEIWDGHHYLFIAENGYVPSGTGVEFIVFYPLYPALIKLFSFLFLDYFTAALFISNTCFIISVIFLYKLCSLDLDSKSSLFACLLFIFFPFGIFTIGVYTESLFIMLSLLCLYSLRKGRFFVAAIAGMLASATRVQGVFLLIPAVYECILQRKGWRTFLTQSLIPLGFILYLCINKIVLGSFGAFMYYQNEIWHQQPSFIWQNLALQFSYVLENSSLSVPIMLPQVVLFFLFVTVFIWAIKKKVRTSYGLYALSYIIIVYSASWLLSGGRYLMALVPFYIAVPTVVNNKGLRITAVILSGILMIFYTYLYATGQNVM